MNNQLVHNFFIFSAFGFNWLDIVIIIVLLLYGFEGYALGFFASFLDLVSFALSFILGLKFYALASLFLIKYFSMPSGFADAIGFFLIAFVSEFMIRILFRVLLHFAHIPQTPLHRYYTKQVNHVLGIIPGVFSATILISFLLTVIIALPLSPFLKHTVTGSKIGSLLISQTEGLEGNLQNIFGGAVHETLNFLTVEPQSNEIVNLHFKTSSTVDPRAEDAMFAAVNKERTSRGLQALTFDYNLQMLARAHAKDMFARGYFSHYTPEGLSPFDRMAKANIPYTYAGENLALAPSTDLAMQGLMQSPGHRANILSVHFRKIGIGVYDGGIYGEMFDQEFTD